MTDLRLKAVTEKLFDGEWYRKRYADVELSGIDPFDHYTTFGWSLQRDPSPSIRWSDVDWTPYNDSFSPWLSYLTDTGICFDELDEFEGAIDFISSATATGWAWSPSAPERAIHVEAVVGDHVVARIRADKPRTDLKAAGKGSGNYGFTLTFKPSLAANVIPVIRVAHASRPNLTWTISGPTSGARGMAGDTTADELTKEHLRFTNPSSEYEDPQSDILENLSSLQRELQPTVIAYYLPQFHQIPENDANWGTGFTEWTQLSRALPRFRGHYQPRIPRDLGFYTLGNEEILQRQQALARAAGVSAFCYYYYWFNGKRVLDRPIETHLRSTVEMPFLLMWANENWTRTWDGREENVILSQDYRVQDEDALLADFARHLDDKRYLRINERPLLIIYNPSTIPNPVITIERWKRKLKEQHSQSPLIFTSQAFDVEDPYVYGLDGAIEFPPHKLSKQLRGRAVLDAYSTEFSGKIVDYKEFITASLQEAEPSFPLIKTAVPSWDNDPRRPNRSFILESSSPPLYQDWLTALVRRSIEKPIFGRPLVAINAWNEWAESAYLEPDVHYGSAYLNATARAVKNGIDQYIAGFPSSQRK